jgi:hypothetical protein
MAARRASSREPMRRSRQDFRRETDLTRLSDIREEGRAILIATNGERTEVDYFVGIKEEPWITATKVVVKFLPGSPADVVLRAAAMRDENDYDEAWVVCDVDEYDVAAALTDAAQREVELILSVPCFEVWLILHLSMKCPGFNDCPQADRHLRKLLRGWDKTALKFPDFRDGIPGAVIRAKHLGQPPEANPSTAVWRLVESLSRPLEIYSDESSSVTGPAIR